MKKALKHFVLFMVIIILSGCSENETLAGEYTAVGGEHSLVFSGEEFEYDHVFKGTYTIKGKKIVLKYDDGIIEEYEFVRPEDGGDAEIRMGMIKYIKEE